MTTGESIRTVDQLISTITAPVHDRRPLLRELRTKLPARLIVRALGQAEGSLEKRLLADMAASRKLLSAVPDLLSLLDDVDPDVRSTVADALSHVLSSRDASTTLLSDATSSLIERIEREEDDSLREGLVIALGAARWEPTRAFLIELSEGAGYAAEAAKWALEQHDWRGSSFASGQASNGGERSSFVLDTSLIVRQLSITTQMESIQKAIAKSLDFEGLQSAVAHSLSLPMSDFVEAINAAILPSIAWQASFAQYLTETSKATSLLSESTSSFAEHLEQLVAPLKEFSVLVGPWGSGKSESLYRLMSSLSHSHSELSFGAARALNAVSGNSIDVVRMHGTINNAIEIVLDKALLPAENVITTLNYDALLLHELLEETVSSHEAKGNSAQDKFAAYSLSRLIFDSLTDGAVDGPSKSGLALFSNRVATEALAA